MNQTKVMLAMVDMAAAGVVLPVENAISSLATLIDRLDIKTPTYKDDVDALLSVGATIWKLRCEVRVRRRS